jgi:hypothetical protein
MTTVSIKIPSTIEDATERLISLGELVTAKEWTRAAIVAAFVSPGEVGGSTKIEVKADSSVENDLEDCSAFARRGIIGLRSKDTVRRYHDAWMSDDRERPTPGAKIELPDTPWPPDSKHGAGLKDQPERQEAIKRQAAIDGTGVTTASDIASNPKAMITAIKADPATARAAREAIEEADRQDMMEFEAQAVAGGGRVPSLEEINARPPTVTPEGEPTLAGVYERLEARAEADKLIDRFQIIVQTRLSPPTEGDEEWLRQIGLRILELIPEGSQR